MLGRNNVLVSARIILILILIMGALGVTPAGASANVAGSTVNTESQVDCEPGMGWMWTNGPSQPEVATQAKGKLHQKGIDVDVEARSYGETDSCGNYHHHGIDFNVRLSAAMEHSPQARQVLMEKVLPVLMELGKPNLGNVKLFSADGEALQVDVPSAVPSIQASESMSFSGDPITKKVYVLIYNPIMGDGRTLTQYMNWNDPATITQQTVDFFSQATNNKITYNVVTTTVVNDWPELVDGFKYNASQYLAVLANSALHHEPQGVNYNKIITAPEFDICGKLNRGEIDELWLYGGPWFGYYESRLAGPGAYWYNSPPIDGVHNCNRLLPIMGPSYERTVNEAVHNFTHRSESTMMRVYGGWQQNSTSHNWNKFGLVKAQSPSYSYSGCGSSHYPPNGVADYDYINPSSVLSNCDDFANYPNLNDPLAVSQPVSCSNWGCMEINYYRYWFSHMPAFPGCGPDNVATDWWKYLANPAGAVNPSYACQSDMRMVSGNVGVGGAIISYTDGTAKQVTTDSNGNYFLMVSNHWSGTITPFRAGYTFTPASKDYTDLQDDQKLQDYTAQSTGTPAFYVNIATGNNSNLCISAAAPCQNIQEAINKANPGDKIYVAGGTYLFSSNASPNVVIINKDLTLSGGWNSDFTAQDQVSIIDGANVNNGILAISGTVVVDNFVVRNSISMNSGAIYIVNGNFTLSRSTLRNNTATSNGAGIFLDNGVLNVVNSTISGNQANSYGGGVYVANSSGASATIRNSTIAYNRAYAGGGITRTNGTYNITNTIIANNTATSKSGPECYGTISTASFNIIKTVAGCSITSGANNLFVDPMIASGLSANMPVHMLLQGSPAINTGTATACPATDQLGTTRPQGSSCDIGAIEYVAPIGDVTPPNVVTVTRADADPTSAPEVGFTVTFSEPVTGVDAGDFALNMVGVSGASIASVSGSNSVYSVRVTTGSNSGTLRLDVADNDSIVDAAGNPLGGVGTANGNFTAGESYTISVPTNGTLTLNSVAANDGWILESNENSSLGGSLNTNANTVDIGDDKSNKQYVGILHFDTSSLPDNAIITSVTLRLQRQGITGTDPFTSHGSLVLDIQKPYFGTTAALLASDFESTAGQALVSTFDPVPVNNWYSAVVDIAGYAYIDLTGTTQFRLRFSTDDDNDRRADFTKFYSGNAIAANRPQLIIQYSIP